jgi:hypothetical protein
MAAARAFGDRNQPPRRCFRFATAALIFLLAASSSVAVAAAKTIQPTARVLSIPADQFHPGPDVWQGRRGIPVLDPGGSNREASGAGSVSGALSSGITPLATIATGTSGALNQPGIFDTRHYPSDSTGAIGPANYVEFVNSKIGVYDRTDLSLISSALDTTFTNGGIVDPQIEWDQQAQRWFYLGIGPWTQDLNPTLSYGWSKTADPSDLDPTDGTSGWCQYLLPSGYYVLDDFPKLGHSNTQLVFGTNMFSANLTDFLGARIWVVPKPAVGVTTCPAAPVATSFAPLFTADGNEAATPVPANNADGAANAWVVAADNPGLVNEGGSASQIMGWHVSGPVGAPVLVPDGNMNVPSFSGPPDVPQPGTSDALDTMPDGRLTQGVAHTDPDAGGARAVWTEHTVSGPGGRSEVRWYELLPATATVRQQGSIKSDDYVFNAAISPTRSGNDAAIFYNLGSTSQLAQIAGQSRLSGDTLSKMSGEVILATSTASLICGGTCRWGDYSGASTDPNDASLVWGTNMLSGPATRANNWRTRNFAVSVGP